MAKKRTKSGFLKKAFWAILIIILVLVGISILGAILQDPSDNDPNVITISTGTQGRFGDIDIGLGDINNGSAFIYLHQPSTKSEETRKVKAGDKLESFGYTIEVKSVNKSYNPSTLIGASHGNIKLLINKK